MIHRRRQTNPVNLLQVLLNFHSVQLPYNPPHAENGSWRGGTKMSYLKVAALAVAVSGGAFAFAPTEAQAQGYGHHGYNGHHQYAQQPYYVHPKIARKIAKKQARLARQQAWEQQYYAQQNYYGHSRPHHYGHGYRGASYHQPRVQSFSYSFGW
jgi:hypothetical protein